MKIFWSWQSDTPGKTGRHFVRGALDAAIQELKESPEIVEPAERDALADMHLDQDRKGVSGSPALAQTIQEKIEQAAVVVGDVTSVAVLDPVLVRNDAGETSAKSKRFINSNVALELGDAFRVLTDRFVLMVMNEHYGSRDDLPFDLRHRAGPIEFNLAPTAGKAEIAEEQKKLVAQLVEALKLCLATKASLARKPALIAPVQSTPGPALFFKRGDVLASAEVGVQEFRFNAEKVAYLRVLVPQTATPVTLAQLVRVFEQKTPCAMNQSNGGVVLRNKDGAIIFDFDGRETITSLTQGFRTGELWGVNGQLILPRKTPNGEEHTLVPMITFEQVFLRSLRNYVAVEAELKQSPPFTVILGATGLDGAYLTVPVGLTGRGEYIGPIMQPAYQQSHTLARADDVSIKNLLRDFFNGIYDLGARSRDEVLSDEVIAKFGLAPR